MAHRQRAVAAALIVTVLLLAVFAMSIILMRIRPLDPEALRAPGFTFLYEYAVA